MLSLNLLVVVSLAYVVFLFLIAFAAERLADAGRDGWLRSPLVYTLSLSIYCTGWTFYGAVGNAARSGMEFVTIYLGPTLVMIGWWWVLRKMVRIGQRQRVTSIADLISSRYGKSNGLAAMVTIMAVIGVTPYIALQLQSVTLSVSVLAANSELSGVNGDAFAAYVAIGLALFAILFGTRRLNTNEQHHGVVIAIAVEAVVKLLALLAVGIYVVWGLSGGVANTLARIDASPIAAWDIDRSRWTALIVLSGAAFLCLPRMFQVMVVENNEESHLRTASWAFPLYLLAMSLFVLPIAVTGLDLMPTGANPDLFVLTVPLSQGQDGLALLAFLGGFSSATSMVIVATLALSTMVSNHLVAPIWLSDKTPRASVSGDMRTLVIVSRRVSIALIICLGYVYYSLSGGGAALAAIGLISFAGVSQFLPALLGGIFWRGATRQGALCGMGLGFGIWGYTMLLPSFAGDTPWAMALLQSGPLGIDWLRPQALFGIEGMDSMVHTVFWSLVLNTGAFCIVSILTFPTPLERLQGAQFVNVYDHAGTGPSWTNALAESEDLMIMAQRLLGASEAQQLFADEAARQGRTDRLPDPTPEFLQTLERELSASVGAATAHAMVGQITGAAVISVEDLIAVADESAQILEQSGQLQAKSAELTKTAGELREANGKLTALSIQKDAFLSQISHELRTPMTSIRAFSEILRDTDALDRSDKDKYAGIIHSEAIRLTRLLDDLLDLSVLENGQVNLNIEDGRLSDLLEHSVTTALAGAEGKIDIRYANPNANIALQTDLDRLSQVFINLISNAQKYCAAKKPVLTISEVQTNGAIIIDFADNGVGLPKDAQTLIFEKFARMSDQRGNGAGLGLAICREIMRRLGGDISYIEQPGGNLFRVTLPARLAIAAQ